MAGIENQLNRQEFSAEEQRKFLERVQAGDAKAIQALEQARQDLGQKIPAAQSVTSVDQEVKSIVGGFGSAHPEFSKSALGDSQGERYKAVLQRALAILQGDVKIETRGSGAHDLMGSLMEVAGQRDHLD
ncbi:MAG: hypothetical protein KGJ93_04890 [Patescibacteria group bacterium]|nr:hypothetical protein [Patescibacteria group bacterium]